MEPVFYDNDNRQADQTEAAYYLGRAYHVEGQNEEAATKYFYVRTHPGDDDGRWAPWATYDLGRLRQTDGRTDDARALYEEVLEFDGDYDFRKSLRRNARLAMQEL